MVSKLSSHEIDMHQMRYWCWYRWENIVLHIIKVWNDFVRGQNQQLVVQGILNKAKSIRNIDTLYKLLDTISNNMETNMTTNEILSFYNVGKGILNKSKDQNINEIIRIQS